MYDAVKIFRDGFGNERIEKEDKKLLTKEQLNVMKTTKPCHQLFKRARGTNPDVFRTPAMEDTYHKYFDARNGE